MKGFTRDSEHEHNLDPIEYVPVKPYEAIPSNGLVVEEITEEEYDRYT